MTQPLREYQARAVNGIRREWQDGHRSVLCVLPTGGGKTRIAEEVISEAERTLFLVHRRELLQQAADRLSSRYGTTAVSTGDRPHAPIQVATVQTLVARKRRPEAGLVIFDEAHHYRAEQWGEVADHYSDARTLGLTATPERQDGQPLGDLFSKLVVGATYSELLELGHLAECDVYQPPRAMGSDLALDPVKAYQTHVPGSRAFVFAGSVKAAERYAEHFNDEGIQAATITAKTRKDIRARALEDFAAGRLHVLCNVYTLTEGVDVPEAQAVILARGCQHVGMYLQIVGRVLRPHPSKPKATCVDLTGATIRHGMPTEDREYSLMGNGITRSSATAIRQCPQCGTVHETVPVCPTCGFSYPVKKRPQPTIFDLELKAVYAGRETPDAAKHRELARLRNVQTEKGFALYWVIKEYRKLFHEDPVIVDASDTEKHNELRKLNAMGHARGYKRGFAAVRFKKLFGHWPRGGMKAW